MKKILLLPFLLIPSILIAQTAEQEKELLRNLLHQFLEGASYNDANIHDRFWADDLIYTGSNGNRITKDVIMSGVNPNPDRSVDPETRYTGEEIQINLYGEVAIVAFKLVAEFTSDPDQDRMEFYNTGTFLKRNGEWRVVAWQATRIPQ